MTVPVVYEEKRDCDAVRTHSVRASLGSAIDIALSSYRWSVNVQILASPNARRFLV